MQNLTKKDPVHIQLLRLILTPQVMPVVICGIGGLLWFGDYLMDGPILMTVFGIIVAGLMIAAIVHYRKKAK